MVCGSGAGVSIAANKFPGIRAAVCHDTYTAHQAVEHDDLNVLCLGARVVGGSLAGEIVAAFLAARFSGEARHRRRLDKVFAIERQFLKRPAPASRSARRGLGRRAALRRLAAAAPPAGQHPRQSLQGFARPATRWSASSLPSAPHDVGVEPFDQRQQRLLRVSSVVRRSTRSRDHRVRPRSGTPRVLLAGLGRHRRWESRIGAGRRRRRWRCVGLGGASRRGAPPGPPLGADACRRSSGADSITWRSANTAFQSNGDCRDRSPRADAWWPVRAAGDPRARHRGPRNAYRMRDRWRPPSLNQCIRYVVSYPRLSRMTRRNGTG